MRDNKRCALNCHFENHVKSSVAIANINSFHEMCHVNSLIKQLLIKICKNSVGVFRIAEMIGFVFNWPVKNCF